MSPEGEDLCSLEGLNTFQTEICPVMRHAIPFLDCMRGSCENGFVYGTFIFKSLSMTFHSCR